MVKIPSEIIAVIEQFIKLVKDDNINIFKVILFGSYARGNYNSDSDIDLAVISPDFIKGESVKNMSALLSKTSGLKADIQSIPFSMEEYNSPVGIMEEILKSGIELSIA